jgi:hypothetical protein
MSVKRVQETVKLLELKTSDFLGFFLSKGVK